MTRRVLIPGNVQIERGWEDMSTGSIVMYFDVNWDTRAPALGFGAPTLGQTETGPVLEGGNECSVAGPGKREAALAVTLQGRRF